MDCEHAINLISADMDAEILGDDRLGLDAHLATCESCRATAQALRLQDSSLRQAFASRREAAAAVADRVIAQLRPTIAAPTVRLPWIPMLLAAAAGFLLAVLIFRPWSSREPQITDVVGPKPDQADRRNIATTAPDRPDDFTHEMKEARPDERIDRSAPAPVVEAPQKPKTQ